MNKIRNKRLFLVTLLSVTIIALSSSVLMAGVRITPSFIFKHITETDCSFALQITQVGGEGKPLRIRAYPAGLQVDLQGLPGSVETEEAKKEAGRLLELKPDSFTLAPGQSQVVEARVNIPKEKQGGIYQSIIFELKDLDIYIKNVKPTTTKLIVPILLVLPGPANLQGEITRMEFWQKEAKRPIFIAVYFLNTGNVHFNPSGKVGIFNSQGRKIANIPLETHTAYPGYPRLLLAQWPVGEAAPGNYEAVANIQIDQGEEIESRDSFLLVKTDTLTQARGAISEFTVEAGQETEPVGFSFFFENQGNISLSPRGNIKIVNEREEKIADLALKSEKRILPDEKEKFELTLTEGLKSGNYQAILEVEYGQGNLKKVVKREKNFFVLAGKRGKACGQISRFVVDYDSHEDTLKYSFLLENPSPEKVSWQGFLEVKNESDKTVGQVLVEKISILPGSVKKIEKTWSEVLPVGFYQAQLSLIDTQGQLLTKEVSFAIQK